MKCNRFNYRLILLTLCLVVQNIKEVYAAQTAIGSDVEKGANLTEKNVGHLSDLVSEISCF